MVILALDAMESIINGVDHNETLAEMQAPLGKYVDTHAWDSPQTKVALNRHKLIEEPINPDMSALQKEFEAGECPGKPGPCVVTITYRAPISYSYVRLLPP
jgi:hypothetical protein